MADKLVAPFPPHRVPKPATEFYATFPLLREALANAIAKSKKQVWLITDYLTDGDIVTSLYLAKYRGLSVTTLLGPGKAASYMSRLLFLKKHQIPVFARPSGVSPEYPTILIVDNTLYYVDGELNFMTPDRSFKMHQASAAAAERMLIMLNGYIKNPIVLNIKPEAIATSPGRNRRRAPRPAYYGEKDGSYNYNKSTSGGESQPGVARQLPKMTIIQKKESQDK
jgi:hypothetical protein